jgi:ectoine hydroxylase-related dioxygenase (phytanoyl-CoA dioxygenase family)
MNEPTLHPWNRDFAWLDHRGPFRRITAAEARSYDEEGFFVLEDAFDAATLQQLLTEIDPIEEQAAAFLRAQPNQRFFIADARTITFSIHLVVRSPRLRAFCAGPLFRDLAADLIGPDVRLYWDQAVYKKSEAPAPFPWHQDNGYTYLEPQQYLTCWIALTDANERNGCPWVVPHLHRRGTLQHRLTDRGWQCLDDPPTAIPVPVRAGGIVVFSSLTPHATGPNRTSDVRKAYIVQFAPDGAHTIQEDATHRRTLTRQDAPERQFLILHNGVAVAA